MRVVAQANGYRTDQWRAPTGYRSSIKSSDDGRYQRVDAHGELVSGLGDPLSRRRPGRMHRVKKRRLPWQFIATALLAGALVIAIAKGQVVAAILVGVLLVPNAGLSVLMGVLMVIDERRGPPPPQ
jgi:hypothetical protein